MKQFIKQMPSCTNGMVSVVILRPYRLDGLINNLKIIK